MIRVLTKSEKREVKKLVTTMCANYFDEYKICLPRDRACHILRLNTTGGFICDYFKNGVLPLNKELEHILLGGSKSDLKECAICKKKFSPTGRQSYCSDLCREEGNRTKSKERMKKKRGLPARQDMPRD